ncbi:type I restriction-modification system endonuclease [Pseudanabaena sp. FACHB-1998]|uniref:type I restriction-modification system endonuclease n=1 Tax=Pseudanabaena sp. FACHB-1998 TaxID=2692858 RepID=UPI001681BF69|nr:type I restriction-modification system endonuclease [Pseudanabaena sp. FACHB-1998]MBD2176547.1 type I restriction-modification system endonuclease [Pseudanabaena sp. FACHB-1998]
MKSANFEFLRSYDLQLVKLGSLAEHFFQVDPNTCLIKLRQFTELLAQWTAINLGLTLSADESQVDLLRRLKLEKLHPEVIDVFHQIRVTGNKANHQYTGDYAEALMTLKLARKLAIWFHRTFSGNPNFKAGAFVPPCKPVDATVELQTELNRLQQELAATLSQKEQAELLLRERAIALQSAEERAKQESEDRLLWEKLALEAEREKVNLAANLTVSISPKPKSPKETEKIIVLAERAAQKLDLDETETRAIIDQQLRDAGWLTDSQELHYGKGTRPVKGRNMAIAEWKTAKGVADYALFVGTRCVALVEAKRRRKNVATAIAQAERYAKGFRAGNGWETVSDSPWGEYQVPFVFASNGRPFLKQLETESGIWFRDVRKPINHSRALTGWMTPEGLEGLLSMDREEAHAKLKNMALQFGFNLYDHQQRAIEKIEEQLASDRRSMLVAMATGTGKTKLVIALLYRLLSTKRFRRVCFVVDRSALGNQTADEFRTTKVETAKTFADILGLKGLKDIDPESETKVHICTIQGLVKRVLYAKENGDIPPIDQYDLILIDECHRGYLLDREMSDAELSFRSQEDYISKYRRVLEHFDAVKIGLTATPALHTREIFGEPIFKYGYRDAVVDGVLIDHEPPLQIGTLLNQSGIKFQANEQVAVYNTVSGEIDLTSTPDELNFEVEKFNKKVITVPFNRAIAQELAVRIDPMLDGKTLIFAANDRHADLIVQELKNAMQQRYEELDNDAIQKLTGSVDDVQTKIRNFRNDSLPKIAVTVDLLTTGIDVPKICNLVFLRRVNSRILYEQMLGRATRRCDEIEKRIFKIYDAVGIYEKMQEVSDMKPVVVDPAISLGQLFDELRQVEDAQHQKIIREQLIVKLRQRLSRMGDRSKEHYEATIGEAPESTFSKFRTSPLETIVAWAKENPQLGKSWEWNPEYEGTWIPISEHDDEVIFVTRGYGKGKKPEDFLDGFIDYVRHNANKIAALTVVLQRPRELTRAQLRELRLEIDKMGYSEAYLQQAWRDTKNEDIAASIIGFVRQAALGDPLIPYEDRVKGAMRRILAKRAWTEPQRQWLGRIEQQIIKEIVVDREALDQGNFKEDAGGFQRLNRIFEGQLETILGDINEELWQRQA